MVIPKKLQQQVLQKVHDGHLGTDGMKSIARQSVWWKNIDSDIVNFAKSCKSCCSGKSHFRSSWSSWPEENQKWTRVHVDLCGPFSDGLMALVIVNAYSRWPEVHMMRSIFSSDIINRLRRTFSQEGVPAVLVSDNGPQFRSRV